MSPDGHDRTRTSSLNLLAQNERPYYAYSAGLARADASVYLKLMQEWGKKSKSDRRFNEACWSFFPGEMQAPKVILALSRKPLIIEGNLIYIHGHLDLVESPEMMERIGNRLATSFLPSATTYLGKQ